MRVEPAWDWQLVFISIVVAVWASGTAIYVARRIRSRSPIWAWLAALCMGGGIWSMHFIGMLAYRVPVTVAYDPIVTFVSLCLPIVGAAIGFWTIRSRPRVPRPLLFAGLVFGASIIAMHYVGMLAMRPSAAMSWDYRWVAVSCAIAFSAAMAAIWVAYRAHHFPVTLSAPIMGVAISGMHYAGMQAVSLHGAASVTTFSDAPGNTLAIAIFVVTGLILTLSLALSFYHRD